LGGVISSFLADASDTLKNKGKMYLFKITFAKVRIKAENCKKFLIKKSFLFGISRI